MLGFIIWLICGCLFIILGICCFFARKPVVFWSNIKMFDVNKPKKYNHAMGKLWCAFGLIFILLGIPLLDGQNSPSTIISILGVFIEIIVIMIVYIQIIEPKYKKK